MFAQDEADYDVPMVRLPMPSSRYLGLVAAFMAIATALVVVGEALA